jgi:catechol 2,3-dioxygenase-like lactoylglutathione lyase family enzyme
MRSSAPEHYGGPVGAIRLDQVNLVVRDVPASRAFYARLGLDFGDEPDPVWDAHHVSARHGDTTPLDVDLDSVTFAAKWNQGGPGRSGAVLGFKVETREQVDALVATLAADGVPVQQEPYDAFWGARYAVVSDPDGNGVGIMSPVDPARRSEAPSPS